ncbi:hypothetical protein SAMN03159343_0174 [Klenkia marina]|uniref:Septum formation n=1 Tax=Klenkia marina TaxID=1960309 RepID=A0A1G4X915_9ACTN|nr:hypothetical protein [Klenkia marina]SCX37699.1 hypothetical protein SAMN03159343_0174 [Klenkia marina]
MLTTRSAHRALPLLAVLLALALVSACTDPEAPADERATGSTGSAASGADVQVPGLDAPAGRGLVGAAPAGLDAVAPLVAPVGSEVPVVGDCLAPVTDLVGYLNGAGVGDPADCGAAHGGVVVGADGFAPADLAFDSSGQGLWTLEDRRTANDEAELRSRATPGCRAQFDAVEAHALAMGAGFARSWALRPAVRLPTREQWDAGERWVACVYLAPTGRTIDGGVDVRAVSADQPLPPSLQSCTSPVGAPTTCTLGEAAAQQYVDLALPEGRRPAPGERFDDDVRAELTGTCGDVLARLDPELAVSAGIEVRVDERTDRLAVEPPGQEQVVGARCELAATPEPAALDDLLA